MYATALFLLCLPSVAHGGSDSGTGAESFPGERLAERLEAHMKERAPGYASRASSTMRSSTKSIRLTWRAGWSRSRSGAAGTKWRSAPVKSSSSTAARSSPSCSSTGGPDRGLPVSRTATSSSAAPASLDPNALKRRFLAIELAEGPAADDERLGHYAEKLGWLLADPEVTWGATDEAAARAWLRRLEEDRFHDLAAVKGQFLAHLLRGLRTIAAHRDRLESGLPPPSKRDTP
jgi:hypothetical protein